MMKQMTRARRIAILIFFVTALMLVIGAPLVSAQSGGVYDLPWNTIDGGGGTSSGGTYSLSGTMGQPDAGMFSGGIYALDGGFWRGAQVKTLLHQYFYLPMIRKGSP
jgi:hypothetical protein